MNERNILEHQKHSLYRLLGEGGELLYVGISLNVAKRMSWFADTNWSSFVYTVEGHNK